LEKLKGRDHWRYIARDERTGLGYIKGKVCEDVD